MQLHRTDAGTYVCVAYNGIGDTVEREINLTVDGKSLNFLQFEIFENRKSLVDTYLTFGKMDCILMFFSSNFNLIDV